MAQRLELQAEPRSVRGKKVATLRRAGILPANIFGHGQSTAIQAPLKEVELLLARGGRTALLSIVLDGARPQPALLKTYTRDPRSGRLTHADFQAVSLTERVTTTIPIRFHGEAPAVRTHGGVLTHPVTEVRIEAVASNLPDGIDVDLASLVELHDAIKVSDLVAPEGVTLLDPPETWVATVSAPRVAEEEAAPEAPAETPAEAAAGEGATAGQGSAGDES